MRESGLRPSSASRSRRSPAAATRCSTAPAPSTRTTPPATTRAPATCGSAPPTSRRTTSRITADNFALGQTTIDNVILEQVIIPNDGASIEFAVEGPTYLPTSCKTSGVSPASFIEPAGPPDYPAGSWRLVCNIGTYVEGAVRIVDTNVRALTTSPNESSFSTLQRVYQATDAAVPATLAAPDIIITAAPRYDFTKGTAGEVPNPLNRQGIGDGYRYYGSRTAAPRIAREVWLT